MAVKPSKFAKVRRSLKTLVKVPPERKEAIWLIEWAHSQTNFPLLKEVILHIANEGKRTKIGGFLLKLMGLRRGVSDFFIPIPHNGYHGLWIELKTMDEKKKPTKEQKEWLEKMKSLGYAGFIAHGWVNASAIISSYLR